MRQFFIIGVTLAILTLFVPTASAATCEDGLLLVGQVCASVGGAVSDLPDTTAHCGAGSGDCVGFASTGSFMADFERVTGVLQDMHLRGSDSAHCESGPVVLTRGICVVNFQTERWHPDYNDICNEITGTATGLTSGESAEDVLKVGPGC